MKKVLIMILIFILMIPLATACDKSEEASIMEVSASNIKNEQLKKLVDSWQQKNGAYLIQNTTEGGAYYLFLNASNLEDETQATYFHSLKVDFIDDIMHVYYDERDASETKNKRDTVLYRIPMGELPKAVKVYRNGVETNFEGVSVIEEK